VNRLSAFVERAQKAIRRYGVRGTVRQAATLARDRRSMRILEKREREFDRRHNIDTAGIVRLQRLDIASDNRAFGNRYQGTTPDVLRAMIRGLDVELGEHIFVDYGSGKGRALFVASEFPFRRIIGIEFSPELDTVAKRNIQTFRSDRQLCHDIEAICIDAAAYDLPAEPAVLYFNNPFEEPVLRKVIARIRRSIDAQPRPVLLLMMGDSPLAHVIEEAAFERVPTSRGTLPPIVEDHPESHGLFAARASVSGGRTVEG
jgi:hypothetical protein